MNEIPETQVTHYIWSFGCLIYSFLQDVIIDDPQHIVQVIQMPPTVTQADYQQDQHVFLHVEVEDYLKD